MGEQSEATAGGMADLLVRHQPVVSQVGLNVVGCQCMDGVFVAGRQTYGSHIVAVLGPLIRQAKAEAWDEGAVAAHHSTLTLFAIKQVNPYRDKETSDE